MPAQVERRQFRCEKCDGRSWFGLPDTRSQCFKCSGYGELVPVGQETECVRQFQCAACDGRAWYARAERSGCRECGEYGNLVPVGEELEYRQFVCTNEDSTCRGRKWEEMAEKSKCRICNRYGEMVPTGEEVGVFICKFVCDCNKRNCGLGEDQNLHKYTVQCRMQNTAECYSCRKDGVKPYAFRPLHHGINKSTDNVHSCSECNGSGDCPNLAPGAGKMAFVCENQNCTDVGRKWMNKNGDSRCFICGQVGKKTY